MKMLDACVCTLLQTKCDQIEHSTRILNAAVSRIARLDLSAEKALDKPAQSGFEGRAASVREKHRRVDNAMVAQLKEKQKKED